VGINLDGTRKSPKGFKNPLNWVKLPSAKN
jgi:hypothetical protein